MVKLANFDQNNKWGGCNKQGGWQKISKVNTWGAWNKRGGWEILAKIIREGAINRKVGKNFQSE